MPKKVKDREHMVNLDKYTDVETHWIALYISNNDAIFFDSFGVEHISNATKKFIGNKNIKTNIFRIKDPYIHNVCICLH